MYGAYKRTFSVFQNSNMTAEGKPDEAELALLEPFRGKVPDEVFGEPFMPPVSDGSGQDRALLRKASQLLQQAGYPIKDGKRVDAKGEPVTIEFLIDEPTFQPHHMPFIKNLATVGIDATLRVVDPVQFRKRVDEFDFDITVQPVQFLDDARRLAAQLFQLPVGEDERLVQSCRHFRSGCRCADRENHRSRHARRTYHRVPGARSRDPRRPLLDTALVPGGAPDRLLGHVRLSAEEAGL